MSTRRNFCDGVGGEMVKRDQGDRVTAYEASIAVATLQSATLVQARVFRRD